jgi:hypothetical protein
VQFLEKYKVDVAAGHVAHNFVKRAIVKGDGRSIDEIATDAGKDAAVSLAVTNVILPALKRVAYEMGFDYGSEYVEVKESTAYGVTHGACRWALDALLAFAKDQTAGK